MFPTLIHQIEHLIEMTGTVASTLTLGAAAGDLMTPLILARLFDNGYIHAFLYVLLAFVSIAASTFLALMLTARRHSEKVQAINDGGRAALLDEEELAEQFAVESSVI